MMKCAISISCIGLTAINYWMETFAQAVDHHDIILDSIPYVLIRCFVVVEEAVQFVFISLVENQC